ncbi:hypothetical protein QE152_g14087 [Popillia japonica]|uniref:Uncharacterized protein n=1 Tax=Popillia japonica TaxID=7064 RepID=A0AAW1LAC7_POPJA
MCSCVLGMWREGIDLYVKSSISISRGPNRGGPGEPYTWKESERDAGITRPPIPIGPERSRYGRAHLTDFTHLVRLRSRQRRAISRI